MARKPRLAAGRARALGVPTRGTTNPNRLRRVDRWMTGTLASFLTSAADPLVVDLGYGATPITTVEMAARLRVVRPDVRVLGLEIGGAQVRGVDDPEIDALVAARDAARGERDFVEADRIRDELAERGITLEDTPGGTIWHR